VVPIEAHVEAATRFDYGDRLPMTVDAREADRWDRERHALATLVKHVLAVETDWSVRIEKRTVAGQLRISQGLLSR